VFEDAPPFKKVSDRSLWFITQLQAGVEWPEECVPWPWAEKERRYTMNFRGQAMPVTHVVLTFVAGERPSKEHQGLHSCDVLWCINGKHLRWGTELENRLDQVERGRGSIGKLGIDAAKDISERHKAFITQLAEEYGCSETTVRNIILSKSWADRHWIAETETT